jgi:hypothetical protein
MNTTVSFSSALIVFNNERISSAASGSSAEVASSDSKIFGLVANARAIPTRCFCPPDSSAG